MTSMKGIIYPYRIRLRYDGGIETLPLILSRIKYERGEPLTVLCLLDSGAQVSLLSKADADELNIVLADGEKMARCDKEFRARMDKRRIKAEVHHEKS